jgi:O-antigen/teichoic acid export membrane protein
MPRLNVDLRGLVHLGNLSKGYFAATIINNAIPFLLLPVLTRYLSPAEYGNIALFQLCLSLSNALTGVSVQTVISKYFFNSEKEYIATIIGNSIYVTAILSMIPLLIFIFFYPYLKPVLELPLLWLILIPPTSFAFTLFSMGLAVMRNEKQVLSFSIHKIGNTFFNLFFSLIFIVLLLWSWQGRAGGIIISYLIGAGGAVYYLKSNGFLLLTVSKNAIRSILAVIIPLIPNGFQSVIISQAGIFFIQYYFTKDILGIYAIGFQLAFIIKILIVTLNLSWSPFLYEKLESGPKINKMYLARMYLALGGIVLAGVIFMNLFSGIILSVMTTPRYFGAREFIPWFTIGNLFFGLYSFLMPVLIKHEKQNFISIISLTAMMALIAFNILFADIFGYIGIAYAYCATYFLMFLAFFGQVQKVMPLPWLKALAVFKSDVI